ncbi:hypothetical protein Z043_114926 [Scleropages formosus]|uniref:Zgc:56699 n=1 Tax=Scleropages formosus TaxID=113540 RepID=A0A0P7YHD5_SCLFO|nr:gametocyte-specific factor 1-like [Scleropages formosus]XP_018615695.1 gametocyte-specific factor 1-like [Scleropages formosus]XP_018615696.1 gametocyte-specific factor 1-like [Scleropages formosus]XP_018615697.1 gametocyte-specific factor 1-like [Scleropages formosus]XP_018615698.1 gametocyte-specific factor 1-like [Scleropages formosus]KPP66563.1 hypothetical protein Z043_114926 [Scleropages formosus]
MSTYRPGFTRSFERCDVESLRPPVEESDENSEDDCDPDKLVQCPFDKNHKIRACRFPYHIIKCRKNHPKLANELRTCPFNARHLMPSHELSHHVANCTDRQKVKADIMCTTDQKKWNVPPSTGAYLSCTEDWDQEADTNVPPFIWGISTSVIQSSLESGTSNYLTSARRAPRTLPWNGL